MRNAVGPMDYTPGAMISMQPNVYRAERPIPQVSEPVLTSWRFLSFLKAVCRCWQIIRLFIIGTKIVLVSLRVFLSLGMKRVALEAKAGEYAIIAKRKGDKWFIGGMTNNGQTEREFAVKLDFLKKDRAYQNEHLLKMVSMAGVRQWTTAVSLHK